MINPERIIAGLRIRAWGLVVLFLANGLALYGMAKNMAGEGGAVLLGTGVIITLLALSVLSVPAKSNGEP